MRGPASTTIHPPPLLLRTHLNMWSALPPGRRPVQVVLKGQRVRLENRAVFAPTSSVGEERVPETNLWTSRACRLVFFIWDILTISACQLLDFDIL